MKTPNPPFVFSRATVVATLFAVVASSGCFLREKEETPAQTAAPAFKVRPAGTTNVVLTPTASRFGCVARVNPQANIIVASFPVGQVPAKDARLSIYRGGQKVGEVKMSEETTETLRVGDIISGSAQEGDEVRAE
jgi:hypothetical protein